MKNLIMFAICLFTLTFCANAQVQTSNDDTFVSFSYDTALPSINPSTNIDVAILSIDECSADKQSTKAFDVVESPLVKKSLIAILSIDEVSEDVHKTKAFDVVESRLVKRKSMIA
jgi:hypothetical protein